MDPNYDSIRRLYEDEIDVYKRHIEELKTRNKNCDETNAGLLTKIRDLQDLLDKASIANKDLHAAFEHVREENLKLQVHGGNQDSNPMRPDQNELAIEAAENKYINLVSESVSWISEKDRLTQRVKFLERECERYTRDNMTLGKQVRHLIKALEEERGMIIRSANQVKESDRSIMSASDIIDSHLVTFESIEELQHQNQKLLSLVKELSQKEEERELQIENEDIKRLNTSIETLKSQLESVKDDRERIMNAFNTILKERDLFKILLSKTRQAEHLTPEIFQRMVSIACASGPAITNETEDTQDKDAHISDLKAMITKLEQELVELREQFEILRTNNEEELKLKTELLEQAHLKILSESQQVNSIHERNQLLESNIQSITREFDESRTKCQKMTFEIGQLKKELSEEKERSKADFTDLFRKTESKLQEIDSKCDLRFELQVKLTSAENEIKKVRDDYENAQEEIDKLVLKVKSLRLQLSEIQRLRDLERSGRLELSRQLYKQANPLKSRIVIVKRRVPEVTRASDEPQSKPVVVVPIQHSIQLRPIQQQPTQLRPIQQQPTQLRPIQQQPTQLRPIQQQPTQLRPIQQQPTQPRPIQQQPTQHRPIQQQPIQQQSIQQQPIQQQPIQQQPIQQQPIQQQPIQQQPTQNRPTQQQPVPQLPNQPQPFQTPTLTSSSSEKDTIQVTAVEQITTESYPSEDQSQPQFQTLAPVSTQVHDYAIDQSSEPTEKEELSTDTKVDETARGIRRGSPIRPIVIKRRKNY